MKVEPPLPPEVLAPIRAPFEGLRAPVIDAPILLPLGPVLDLAGEAMRGRLFVVQGDGEDAVLRPDFTIAVARAHIADGLTSARYLYEGKAFRVAPKGSGRSEEFLQIGLEVFGGGRDAKVDAEVASLAWRSAAAGGRTDLYHDPGRHRLVRGHDRRHGARPRAGRAPETRKPRARRDDRPGDRPRAHGRSPRRGRGTGSRPCWPTCRKPRRRRCWRICGQSPASSRWAGARQAISCTGWPSVARAPAAPAADAGRGGRHPRRLPGARRSPAGHAGSGARAAQERRARAGRRIRRLGDTAGRSLWALGRWRTGCGSRPAFGRSFNYYDGFLFEVRSPAFADDAPVAAGGRYDGLPGQLGGEASGAVGCAVRPGRAWVGAEGPG